MDPSHEEQQEEVQPQEGDVPEILENPSNTSQSDEIPEARRVRDLTEKGQGAFTEKRDKFCQELEALWTDIESQLLEVTTPPNELQQLLTAQDKLVKACNNYQKAIAAVAYLRTTDSSGEPNIGFVLGKAKVAPTSGHTIPRLELSAAVLAVEITQTIMDNLDLHIDTAHEDAAVWSENPIKYTDTEIHLDADKALDDLAKYVYNNSYLMLNVDHVMAFTGQDLVRNNSGDLQRQVKGYTYVNNIEGIICKQPWYAVSIIESPAIGFVARTAAHELAHNMRCGHDVTPGCSTEEQFVMSPNFNIATYKYRTNPYKFSPCCIESIRAHLKNLSAMISNETTFEHRYECLNHHSAKDDFSYLDRSILPGQRYTLNDQCRYLLNDPNSFLCGKPIPTYCWGLVYCFSQDGFCYGMYGYNGSPCNVTSICYYGNCVLNELIPTITSTEAANTTIESTTEEQTTTGVTELITTTEEVTTVETELTTTTEKVTTVEIELTTTPEKVTTVETELTTLSEEVTSVETELTTTTETSPPPEFTTETESTEEVTPSATELTTTTEDANLPQWSHWTLCRKNCVRLRFRYCGYMEKTCKRRVKQYEACTNDYCQEDTAKTIKAIKGKGKRKDEGKSKGKDEDEDEDKRKDKDKSKGKGNRKDESKSKGKDGDEGKGKRKDKGKSKGKGKGKR
ncbi:uncharacterized protein LOC143071003 [Mytilus galloprovincialis]|uniref:uncharacterized protein LOC143071003 n=1 Tax=Mytilus galloprovincialis TaxID=29158 RepID=UPI003F7B7AD6